MIIMSLRMSTAVLYEMEMLLPRTSIGFEHWPAKRVSIEIIVLCSYRAPEGKPR